MYSGGHLKEFLIRFILIGGSILVSVFILEFFLRWTPLVRLLPYGGIPNYFYEPDSLKGYDIAPNFPTSTLKFRADGLIPTSYPLFSNELGCFDTPYGGEKPNILLLGDSFTWGYVRLDQNWGKVLEKNIGERVLTCGVAGFGTKQELLKAEGIVQKLATPPTTILLAYNNNDIADDTNFPNRFVYNGILIPNLGEVHDYKEIEKQMPSIYYNSQHYCMWNEPAHASLQRVKCYLSRNSIIYLVVKDKIKDFLPFALLNKVGLVNSQPTLPTTTADPHVEENLANILAFAEFAKSQHIEFKVVLVTTMEMLDPNAKDSYRGVKALLDAQHVEYFDTRETFMTLTQGGMNLYWPSNYHWNIPGNELAGLIVAQWWLKSSSSEMLLKNVDAQLSKNFNYSLTNTQ
jgi:hypothetical protein